VIEAVILTFAANSGEQWYGCQVPLVNPRIWVDAWHFSRAIHIKRRGGVMAKKGQRKQEIYIGDWGTNMQPAGDCCDEDLLALMNQHKPKRRTPEENEAIKLRSREYHRRLNK